MRRLIYLLSLILFSSTVAADLTVVPINPLEITAIVLLLLLALAAMITIIVWIIKKRKK